MNTIQTSLLDIAFEQMGPVAGKPVFFLHGWPDAPRSRNVIAGLFASMRYRCPKIFSFFL
jgi:hypothetical protein